MLGTKVAEPEKVKKGISKVSKKQKKVKKELIKIIEGMKKKEEYCMVRSPECTGAIEGSHHIVKRSPKNVTNPKNIILSCNACNLFIELNQEWAEKNKFWQSKHKKVA